MSQLEESIYSYLEEHPTTDLQELYTHFGLPNEFAANVLENMDGQQFQTQLHHYRWRRIIVAVVLGLALLYGIFYCKHIAIDYIFYPGYVIIGEAQEDEMPISISTPVE